MRGEFSNFGVPECAELLCFCPAQLTLDLLHLVSGGFHLVK